MKKAKILSKRIKIPIYTGYVIIAFFDDREEVLLKYKIKDHTLEGDAGAVFTGGWLGTFTQVLVFDKTLLNHSTIAHEVIHATNNVLDFAGVKTDGDNDEAMAYFVGWLTLQIYKAVEHFKLKITTKCF